MRTQEHTSKEFPIDAARAILRESLPRLLDEFGVSELGVFGSYVTGHQNADSDLDVLVDFEASRRITMFDFVGLELLLTELTGIKVDLVMKSSLKPRIGERILAQVIPV